MAFQTVTIIENCMLQGIRKKAEYDGNKKIGEKNVVDVVFVGDKPVTCDITPEMVSSLKTGVWWCIMGY